MDTLEIFKAELVNILEKEGQTLTDFEEQLGDTDNLENLQKVAGVLDMLLGGIGAGGRAIGSAVGLGVTGTVGLGTMGGTGLYALDKHMGDQDKDIADKQKELNRLKSITNRLKSDYGVQD